MNFSFEHEMWQFWGIESIHHCYLKRYLKRKINDSLFFMGFPLFHQPIR